MKILIPVIGFGKSGGYRVLSILANELVSSGNQVSFVSSAESIEPHFATRAKIIWIANEKAVTNPTGNEGNFLKHLRTLRTAMRNKAIVGDVDIILATHPLIAIGIPKPLRQKTIYYSQAYEPDYYYELGGLKNFLLAKLSEKAYKLGLYTIVNSPVFTNFKLLSSERVLLPGIDKNIFFPKAMTPRLTDSVILGTIGRAESYKGSSYIIDAFNILSKKHPSWKLRVAFERKEYGEDNIECVHPKNDKELADYYRGIDLYICTGVIHPGAFHYPVVEAMACGTSVVSTPYYGVNKDTAFVLKERTVEHIISVIEFAVENQELRNRKILKGLDEAAKLSWSFFGQTLLDYLNEKLRTMQTLSKK